MKKKLGGRKCGGFWLTKLRDLLESVFRELDRDSFCLAHDKAGDSSYLFEQQHPLFLTIILSRYCEKNNTARKFYSFF